VLSITEPDPEISDEQNKKITSTKHVVFNIAALSKQLNCYMKILMKTNGCLDFGTYLFVKVPRPGASNGLPPVL